MRLIADGNSDADIGSRFEELCAGVFAETGRSRDDLVALFGRTRDAWIRADLDDWLGRHRFYPGVLERLSAVLARHPVFILTTKQERFAEALLRDRVPLDASRIFGLDAGRSKEDLLLEFLNRPSFSGAQVHFVEDRLDTLLRVADVPDLEPVQLYLADWGYTTAAARDHARAHPRIIMWTLEDFLRPAGEIP